MTYTLRKDFRNHPLTHFIDSVIQNNMGNVVESDLWGGKSQQKSNIPVNIKESQDAYELQFVAPGLAKEDFKINLSGNNLTISYEHTDETETEADKKNWIKREFSKKSFSRSFNVGDNINVNEIDATYADGILNLTLPKKEEAQKIVKQIEIK